MDGEWCEDPEADVKKSHKLPTTRRAAEQDAWDISSLIYILEQSCIYKNRIQCLKGLS